MIKAKVSIPVRVIPVTVRERDTGGQWARELCELYPAQLREAGEDRQ